MYEMILRVVERPLFEVVMKEAGGNQSRAAEWLGLEPQHPAQGVLVEASSS